MYIKEAGGKGNFNYLVMFSNLLMIPHLSTRVCSSEVWTSTPTNFVGMAVARVSHMTRVLILNIKHPHTIMGKKTQRIMDRV